MNILCRPLDDLIHLLIELFDDRDCLVVENDIATPVTTADIGDTFDTSFIQVFRGCFIVAMPDKHIRD